MTTCQHSPVRGAALVAVRRPRPPSDRPWPVPARLAFIVGASAAGWLLIGLAARRVM